MTKMTQTKKQALWNMFSLSFEDISVGKIMLLRRLLKEATYKNGICGLSYDLLCQIENAARNKIQFVD